MHRLPAVSRLGPAIALLCVVACTSDEWPYNEPDEDDDSESSGDSGDVPTPMGVRIAVFEPQSPSIHYIGDTVPLVAEVRDADELPFAYEDIVWRASDYEPTLHVGAEGDVELPPGAYDVTATARLANGDHLVATVGGVRVQARWTGTYEGQTIMVMHAMFQGIPISPQCVGALALRVDYDGDTVEIGGGTCSLNAVLLQLDATYEINGTFMNGVGTGTIDYDLGGLFALSFEWTGAFVEEGFLGAFTGTTSFPLVGDIEVEGRFDAPLQSPFLEDAP